MVYAESFDLTGKSGTKSKTITLPDNKYTHAIIYINIGTTVYNNEVKEDYARTAYLCANNSAITWLYTYEVTSASSTAGFKCQFSGNTITLTAVKATTVIGNTALYGTGSGVVVAYK